MDIFSTYSVKIKYYNKIFRETVIKYRNAVDWFIDIIIKEYDNISQIQSSLYQQSFVEQLTIPTKKHPSPKYNFDIDFYKFPCYLRRAAINEALGKVSSYKKNLENNPKTGLPRAGYTFPAMYKNRMFVRTGTYTAKLKVWINNTWDWLEVELKKSDIDYILRHCSDRKECVPTLQQRGKEWFLDFCFQEKVKLKNTDVFGRKILAIDFGLNNACTCSVMTSDGTILDREFLSLPREQNSLNHALNRIKKAQQNGNKKVPRLWAFANNINNDIAIKTADFIIEKASENNVDVIVMEALDLNGKISGPRKQKLHLWKVRYIQGMVEDKAHRLGIRISRVCAWNTSRLAFDGSGKVVRGIDNNYSVCQFTTGKIYNCDLNASYNIGARYFIREILKSLSVTTRLEIEAKVPQCSKRSTCTLSVLLNLNAELIRLTA